MLFPDNTSISTISPLEIEVRLTTSQSVYIVGQCNVVLVEGTIDIMGYRVEGQGSTFYLCSPKCYSLVPIVNMAGLSVVRLQSVSNGLPQIQGVQSAFSDILSFSNNQPEDIPGCWLVRQASPDIRMFEPGQRWHPIVSEVAPFKQQVILVCGGRKTGKSTFCRYLFNRLLNYHQSVAMFDFDCGQAELTPPGFLSYIIGSAPLLTPSFVNVNTLPTKSRFYGSVTPSDNPKLYLELCLDLWKSFAANPHPDAPIVINTLGWVSGLGLSLLSHLLHHIQPTHVIAFGEEPPAGEDFVSKALYSLSGFSGDVAMGELARTPAIAYVLPVSSSTSLRISPGESRSLSFWSYFHFDHKSRLFDFSNSLSKKQPYVISQSALLIKFLLQASAQSFWPILNCALVALAYNSSASNDPCYEIQGLGLIRGVNPREGTIFLVTPLPLDVVCMCTVLIVSQMSLPPAMLTHGGLFDGPYLSFQSSSDTTGFNPRKVRHNIIRQSTIKR